MNNASNNVLEPLAKLGSGFSLAEEIRQHLELVRQRCAPTTALRALEEAR